MPGYTKSAQLRASLPLRSSMAAVFSFFSAIPAFISWDSLFCVPTLFCSKFHPSLWNQSKGGWGKPVGEEVAGSRGEAKKGSDAIRDEVSMSPSRTAGWPPTGPQSHPFFPLIYPPPASRTRFGGLECWEGRESAGRELE